MLVFSAIGMVGLFAMIVALLFGERADPRWIVARAMARSLASFGAGGAIARSYRFNVVLSIAIGVCAGLPAAFMGVLFIRFFGRLPRAKEAEEGHTDDSTT
jgi:H+/gluconate symporter-like permease